MDSIRKALASLADLLAHPAVVAAICMGVDQGLPEILTYLDMLPPQYRGPAARGIAVLGFAVRVLKMAADGAVARDAKKAALAAATEAEAKKAKEAKEMVP